MKILIRGANWVGDAVMTIPAMREIRRCFPASSITLLTRDWARGIFQDADFVDEIITLQPDARSFRSMSSEAKRLRNRNFDAAILFTNSFESALLMRLAKIPRRFGYAKEFRSFLLTDPFQIPEWKNERHEIFFHLNLVREIDQSINKAETVFENEPQFNLTIDRERQNSARKFLEQNGVDLNKKLVAFVAGSTNSRAKRWGAERYAMLNDLIRNDLGAEVVLLGAPDEFDVSNLVFEGSVVKPVILTGKTTLSQVTAILSLCDLLISNDTGPAHIAAALGTKTLVIFGPTNPKTTKPWNAEIIREEVECSPCMLRDCPIDHRCMSRISPGKVFEKAASML